MTVWVWCARGVQVAYVTLHHRGCTLVPPFTWAKRVPGETIYGLNSGVFLSTLLHISYPDQGVVWRSIQSVFTRLFTCFLLTFSPPRICASVC